MMGAAPPDGGGERLNCVAAGMGAIGAGRPIMGTPGRAMGAGAGGGGVGRPIIGAGAGAGRPIIGAPGPGPGPK